MYRFQLAQSLALFPVGSNFLTLVAALTIAALPILNPQDLSCLTAQGVIAAVIGKRMKMRDL